MIIYSVTINIQSEAAKDWVEWMNKEHIPDVMITGKFTNYHFHELIYPKQDDSSITYNVQYECDSIEKLNEYQQEFAPKLQADALEKFKDKFVAFRTVLKRLS